MFLLCTTVCTTGYVYIILRRRHTQTREREKTCENEKWVDEPPPRYAAPSARTRPMRLSAPLRAYRRCWSVLDDVPPAWFCSNPTDGGIIRYLPAWYVRFSCVLPLLLYRWYVNGFDFSSPNQTQGGIQYSMDSGFGRWNGLKRCITYNAPARITHVPFLWYFECQRRRCNISKWKATQTIRQHRSIK